MFLETSTAVSVPGNLRTTVPGNLHTNQCLGESPHQSVLWGISTPVSCGISAPVSVMGQSPHQSVFWGISLPVLRGISIPVSCGISAPVSVMDNPHTSQCSGESPHHSVFWTIPTRHCSGEYPRRCFGEFPPQSVFQGIFVSVYSIDCIVTCIKTQRHLSRNQFGKDHAMHWKAI